MKKIKDFEIIEGALYNISECPNFSDEMRNKAHDLRQYIKENKEPEVIIKKSGDTWVKREDGNDYISMHDSNYASKPKIWKPISEIEITDEIAKLRPMVVEIGGSVTEKLYAVDGRRVFTSESVFLQTERFRLATVEDLED